MLWAIYFLIEFFLGISSPMILGILLCFFLFVFVLIVYMRNFADLRFAFDIFGRFILVAFFFRIFLYFRFFVLPSICLFLSPINILSWDFNIFIIIVAGLFNNLMFLIHIYYNFYLISAIFWIYLIWFGLTFICRALSFLLF